VTHVVPVATQTLMLASPIAYATTAVPEQWRWATLLNPVAPLIEGFRWSVLGDGQAPAWPWVLYAAACAAASLAVGGAVFRRMERRFADVI